MYIYSTTILLFILLYSTIYSTFCTLGLWHLTNRSNEKAEFECDFLYYFPFFVKTPYMIGNSFFLALVIEFTWKVSLSLRPKLIRRRFNVPSS